MEEFIEQNKDLFVEYLKSTKEKREEIETLEQEITEKKAGVIHENITFLEEPYKVIESKKNEIREINIQLANLREMTAIERNRGRLSDKIEIDFNYEIEKTKLEDKQRKLQKEVDKIIEGCKNKLEITQVDEEIKSIQGKIKDTKRQIEDKREDVKYVIQQSIEEKEGIIKKISAKEKQEVDKIIKEAEERRKAVLRISERSFGDDEELNNIKDKTIRRLEKEIEEKKTEIEETRAEYDGLRAMAIEYIEKLETLKSNLDKSETENRLRRQLGMKNEKEKMPEDTGKETETAENGEAEEKNDTTETNNSQKTEQEHSKHKKLNIFNRVSSIFKNKKMSKNKKDNKDNSDNKGNNEETPKKEPTLSEKLRNELNGNGEQKSNVSFTPITPNVVDISDESEKNDESKKTNADADREEK